MSKCGIEFFYFLGRSNQKDHSPLHTHYVYHRSEQEANLNHGYSIQAVAVQLTKLSGIGFPTAIIFYRKNIH